jgi:hypothetical protein
VNVPSQSDSPSALHTSELIGSPRPRQRATSAPSAHANTRTLWSQDPLARKRPSGEYAAHSTAPSCAPSTRTTSRRARSISYSRPSSQHAAARAPSGESAKPARPKVASPPKRRVPRRRPRPGRRQSCPSASRAAWRAACGSTGPRGQRLERPEVARVVDAPRHREVAGAAVGGEPSFTTQLASAIVATRVPRSGSQTPTVPSSPAEATSRPEGCTAT